MAEVNDPALRLLTFSHNLDNTVSTALWEVHDMQSRLTAIMMQTHTAVHSNGPVGAFPTFNYSIHSVTIAPRATQQCTAAAGKPMPMALPCKHCRCQ
jgi:hypothetical protein